MSRKGNPYDNAACESFMKTLKYEEVYRNEYRDFQEARASIGEFLERVYNQKRLHSALGYVPPAEFENGATHEILALLKYGGSAPATPGFNAVAPEWLFKGRLSPPPPFRPPSRRSGRIPALPYPPLRCFQSGSHQPRRSRLSQRTAITPLTSCLTPGVHFTAAPCPTPPSSPRPSFLRCASDSFLLTKPNTFLHNRDASVATLRWCSGSSRNAVRTRSGICVQLHRNPHEGSAGL